MRRCIGFKEVLMKKSVVYVPCLNPMKGGNNRRRFCSAHEKAYRELLLAIKVNGRPDKDNEEFA
jgi:hypothetical protein